MEPGWSQAGASSLSVSLDWEGLQLGGTICAGLLCIVGLLFALSEQWVWWGGEWGAACGNGVAQEPQTLCTDVSSSRRWQMQMQAQSEAEPLT